MTGQPSAVDVLDAAIRKELLLAADVRAEVVGTLLADLAAAGLLATPERLAQERATALGEAAEAVGYQDWAGQEHNAETWLSARAEAEMTRGETDGQ